MLSVHSFVNLRFLGFLDPRDEPGRPRWYGHASGCAKERRVCDGQRRRRGHAREAGFVVCSRSGSNTNAGASGRLNAPRVDASAFVSAHRVWFESAPFSPLPFPPNVALASDAGSTSDSDSSIPRAFNEHGRSTILWEYPANAL